MSFPEITSNKENAKIIGLTPIIMKLRIAIAIYTFHRFSSFSYLVERKYIIAAKMKYNIEPNPNSNIETPLWANARVPAFEFSAMVTIINKTPIIT